MSGDALTQRRRGAERGSWPRVRLGEVCEVLIGNSAPQEASCFKGGTYSFVRTSDVGGIHFGILNNSRDLLNDAGIKGMRLFSKGSILFPKSGASAFLNHRVMLGIDAFVSSHLAVIEASGRVDSKYLLHYLMTVDTKNLLQNSAYPSLRRGDIVAIPVPLPPLAEQRRIASKLDLLCDIVTKRKAQLSQLQQLVKSRFVEMFGDPMTNPNGWPMAMVGDHLRFLTSGSRGWAKYYADDGELFITIKNVKGGKICTNDVQHVKPPTGAETERTRVQEGDLLISITADLGRTGIVTRDLADQGAYINQHLSCARLDRKSVEPLFVAFYLESTAGKAQFEKKNQSAVKAGLNFEAIRSLRFYLPPLALQREFAAFVAKVDKLAFAVRKSLESAEKLYRQQLSEAFS